MNFRPRHVSESDLKIMRDRVRRGLAGPGIGGVVTKVEGVTVAAKSTRSRVGNPASSPYRSKWEEQYAYVLTMEKHAGLIKDWAYERMTIKLAKGRYHRTDFTIWHNDDTIELAAVKGHHKNLRDSMTHIKWAAKDNPWFRFTLKRKVDNGWQSEDVTV